MSNKINLYKHECHRHKICLKRSHQVPTNKTGFYGTGFFSLPVISTKTMHEAGASRHHEGDPINQGPPIIPRNNIMLPMG